MATNLTLISAVACARYCFSFATKERSKVIYRDLDNYHAYSLSYYIYVVTEHYRSKNDFTELTVEVIAAYIFVMNLYTKSP